MANNEDLSNTLRKRRLTLAIVLALVLGASITAAFAPALLAMAAGRRGDPILPDYVRLQVIANSDSDYDQAVKQSVRDAVCSSLADQVSKVETQPEALRMLAGELDRIQHAVDETLAGLDSPYPAEIGLGPRDFPAKSYGGKVVPPGTYPALRVTLGRGNGSNWWCVVFPPLCFVDAGAGLATATEPAAGDGQIEIRIRSWLLERLATSDWQSAWEHIKAHLEIHAAQ